MVDCTITSGSSGVELSVAGLTHPFVVTLPLLRIATADNQTCFDWHADCPNLVARWGCAHKLTLQENGHERGRAAPEDSRPRPAALSELCVRLCGQCHNASLRNTAACSYFDGSRWRQVTLSSMF